MFPGGGQSLSSISITFCQYQGSLTNQLKYLNAVLYKVRILTFVCYERQRQFYGHKKC